MGTITTSPNPSSIFGTIAAQLRGETLAHRETLQVFVEGDVLYDAMLSDIGRAEHSVRFVSYILTSDAVGRVFVEALSRCAARGLDVRLRADHAGSWRELDRGDIDAMRAARVRFEWSRPWSLRRPFTVNRRNHRKLLAVDGAIAYVGGFNLHVPSSQRAYGPKRWRDTHVRFLGESAAAAAVVFDRYRDVQPDWLPPTTGSRWLLPNRSKACRHRLRCVLHDTLRAAQ